jgi:hypothetical protein
MPRYHAEFYHPEMIEEFLREQGFAHLRAKKRGSIVTITSGPQRDPVKHFRVRRDTVHLWCLDMADHRGRWEPTPYREVLKDLLHRVVDSFSWVLSPADENPERTSDPED